MSSFELLSPVAECSACERGLYEDLIGGLANVHKLTINQPLGALKPRSSCRSDPQAGAPPTQLRLLHPEDGQGGDHRKDPFSAKQVFTLLNTVAQLSPVEIPPHTHAGWSAKVRKVVERVTRRHTVELKWGTSITSDDLPFIYPPN